MKAKDKTQLQSMTEMELVKVIAETQTKLAQFLVNRYSKQSKNVREGRAMKRKIAVARTILAQKELQHG